MFGFCLAEWRGSSRILLIVSIWSCVLHGNRPPSSSYYTEQSARCTSERKHCYTTLTHRNGSFAASRGFISRRRV